MRCRDRFGGLIEFCGETDSIANTDSKAYGNASANSDPGTLGHTNPDPGCRNKSMSSSAGLCSHILKHEYEFA